MNNEAAEKFVLHLTDITKSKEISVALKKGLVAETEHYTYKYVMPWCGDKDKYGYSSFMRNKKALVFAAATYAILEGSASKGNFGNTMRVLSGVFSENSMDDYFGLVCSAQDIDELRLILPRIVYMCKSKEVPINIADLALDMYWWDWEPSREKIRVKWAYSFYA